MNYYILKGQHGSLPRHIRFYSRKTSIIWYRVRFSDLKGVPTLGHTNKLFGVSYNIFPFIDDNGRWDFDPHHMASARFGWKPSSISPGKIQICAYNYVSVGNRIIEPMVLIDAERDYYFYIQQTIGKEIINVNMTIASDVSKDWEVSPLIDMNGNKQVRVSYNGTIVRPDRKSPFFYGLGPYYGGEPKAPKTIKIEMI